MLLIELLRKRLTAGRGNELSTIELSMGFSVLLSPFLAVLPLVPTTPQNSYHNMYGFFTYLKSHA